MAGAPARAVRTPQQQRSDKTRRAVLDATVACLMEYGFARTTTLEVQRRAGVSRGALLHHFPSKAELLVATVDHLAGMRGRELKDKALRLPAGAARVDAAIDLLWESFTGPLFAVAMELRNAARTDPELRPVLATTEREVHDRIIHQSRHLFGDDVAGMPGFECAIDITLQLMIGAATSTVVHHEPKSVEQLIHRWKAVFPSLLEGGAHSRGDI